MSEEEFFKTINSKKLDNSINNWTDLLNVYNSNFSKSPKEISDLLDMWDDYDMTGNRKFWDEDISLKLRRHKVKEAGFTDFNGLPDNIEDRFKGNVQLPIVFEIKC